MRTKMMSIRTSVIINAILVNAMIFNGMLSCKQRNTAEVKDVERKESKLFEDYLDAELDKKTNEEQSQIYDKIAKEATVLAALSRAETVTRLVAFTKKIYLDNSLVGEWNEIPAEKRAELSQSLVDFALLRYVVELRKTKEAEFATVVRDVYNATVGAKYFTQKVNGKTTKIDNPNWNKIPLERFDDSRSSISDIADESAKYAFAALVVGALGSFAIIKGGSGFMAGMDGAAFGVLSVAAAAAIIGLGQVMKKLGKAMDDLKNVSDSSSMFDRD